MRDKKDHLRCEQSEEYRLTSWQLPRPKHSLQYNQKSLKTFYALVNSVYGSRRCDVDHLRVEAPEAAADVTVQRLVMDCVRPPYTILFKISSLLPPFGVSTLFGISG